MFARAAIAVSTCPDLVVEGAVDLVLLCSKDGGEVVGHVEIPQAIKVTLTRILFVKKLTILIKACSQDLFCASSIELFRLSDREERKENPKNHHHVIDNY